MFWREPHGLSCPEEQVLSWSCAFCSVTSWTFANGKGREAFSEAGLAGPGPGTVQAGPRGCRAGHCLSLAAASGMKSLSRVT